MLCVLMRYICHTIQAIGNTVQCGYEQFLIPLVQFGQVIKFQVPSEAENHQPVPGLSQVHVILSCAIQYLLSSLYSLANPERVHISSLQSPFYAELSFQTVEKPAATNSLHSKRRQTQSSANTNAIR